MYQFDQSVPRTLPALFIHFMARHRWKFIVLLITMTVWPLTESYTHYFVKLMIDQVTDYKGPKQDIFFVITPYVLGYIGISILLEISLRAEDWLKAITLPVVRAEIRAAMFEYAERHSYRYFQENLPGTLASRIASMGWSFEAIYSAVAHSLYPVILNVCISGYLMWTVHGAFAVLLGLWFVIMLLMTAWMSKTSYYLATTQAQAENTVIGKIVDSFQNIGIVRAFHGHAYENADLSKYQDIEVAKAKAFEFANLRIHFTQGILSTTMLCGMIVLLVLGWKHGYVSAGDFAFVASTSFSTIRMVWWASEQLVMANKELGTAKQALSLLQEPHEIVDIPRARPLEVQKGEIVFNQVTFMYPPNRMVFQDRNLVIPAGQKVGLVGFSGSGKTTFINLILRFFDVRSGEIRIDGQDIRKVTLESLRHNIAVIPQEPYLFHRTIYDNILYGRLNATKEEVKQAAKMAHCEEFITHLKEGYQTMVGERGSKLSGGQRQRISIARAFLKNAPILFLDEATSALDAIGERLIQDSLQVLMQSRTTIVIAHRLSTLLGMDRLLVFKDFQIVEDGSHEELLALGGYYTQLWDMQAFGMLPEDEDEEEQEEV